MTDTAIGGYFGLELKPGQGEWLPDALRFQSARAAFLALLSAGRPSRVWLPWYICDSMLEPPRMAGVPVSRYSIGEDFYPVDDIALRSDEWLLYVNYFGMSGDKVDRLLGRYPGSQVVVDNAQAFYAPPGDCLATLYSPRKFFGVPDGGYLQTGLKVPEPRDVDEGSVARCAHLLKRRDLGPEAGYLDYQAAEHSLAGQMPKRMSVLTRDFLAAIDYAAVRARRLENFSLLHEHLGEWNQIKPDPCGTDVPMCYPFRTDKPGIRGRLIGTRVFVPTYWPELLGDSGDTSMPSSQKEMAGQLIPLPCDQRYGKDALMKVVKEIAEAFR